MKPSFFRAGVFTSLYAIVWLLSPVVAHAAPTVITQPANVTAAVNSTATFTVSVSGAAPLAYRWRKNGSPITPISAATNATYVVNPVSDSDAGASFAVVITNSTGSITSSPAILTVIHPPIINSPPNSQVALVGDIVSFNIGVNSASTPPTLSYQWKKSGVDILGQTSNLLNFAAVAATDAASYSVFVTNVDGSVTSSNALLTVVEPIVTQSVANPVNTCTNVTFSVITYGSDALTYQWFTNDIAVVGATGATYTVSDIILAYDGTTYSVDVSNPEGIFATAETTIVVTNPPPVIAGIPANIVTNTGPGNPSCSQFVSWVEPTVSDNCSGMVMSSNYPSGAAFPVGVSTVTYIATDSLGQTTTSNFTVTVNDTTPPTVVFNHISVQLDASGNYSLTPGDIAAIAAGSTNACGLAGTNVSQTSFSFCDVAVNPIVTLTLTNINGTVAVTNGTITVLAPTNVPANVYVDASYPACSGPVNFPNVGGGTYYLGYNAFTNIQSAINAVTNTGTVHVAAGTYNGAVTASKSVTLLGANAGIGGCGARGAESVISVGVGGTAVNITADNVTVDGFALQGSTASTGLNNFGHTGVVVQNNAVSVGALGISMQNLAGAFTVQNNCVTVATNEIGSTPTIGIVLAGISGSGAQAVQNNNVSGSLYGYLLADVNGVNILKIQGGTITGVMRGVASYNYNLAGNLQKPSAFTVDGVTMSGFTGTSVVAPRNIQAGVYVFTGGADTTATVTATITNVTVTGTGKIGADTAGMDFADFSTGSAIRQQITVLNCNVSTNKNRGIFASGAHATVTVTGSSILGNGFDPYTTGGNHGFGVIARNNAQMTVGECFIANPATTMDIVTAVNADANTNPEGPTLIVTNCSILNSGNLGGKLAGQSAGTLNASGNWWGSVSDTGITNLMSGVVDFTPYLGSGVDSSAASGFQGDFSTLYATANGAQTGSAGRVQEGIDTVIVSGVVNMTTGTFTENILLNKKMSLIGLGSGIGDTVLATAAGDSTTGVIQLSASGASDADPVLIKDVRISAVGRSGISVGQFSATNGISVQYVRLENVKVMGDNVYPCSEQERGLYVDKTSSVLHLTVTNCAFNDLHYGWYFHKQVGDDGSTVQYVQVTDTTFNHNNTKGIYAEKLSDATFTRCSISTNGYDTNLLSGCSYFIPNIAGADINLKAGAYGNLVFDQCDFSGNALGAANGVGLAIKGRGTGSDTGYAATPATVTGVTVTDSLFAGNQIGIRLGEPGKGNTTPTGVVIQNNGFVGNIAGGLVDALGAGAPPVVATSNWWGNVSGPTIASNPYGTGDGVAGNVSFGPWLANGDATPGSIGFQPVPGVNNPPTHMVFTTQPGGAMVGGLLAPQPIVTIKDASGNTTPWANPDISLAISNNPTGYGVLTGTATTTAANGVATFTNLSITVAGGVGYTLGASESYAVLPVIISDGFTVTNPLPAITSLNPYFALAGGADFTLTVSGSNFVHDAVVDWNGSTRPTVYVSPTQVNASISSSDIASVGIAQVTVTNPAPGGGVSAPVDFEIHVAIPPVVFVATNYIGLPTNTPVSWPSAGAGTNIIGYNAFATIQGGVDAVALRGAVKVAKGIYEESLDIEKPLSLIGPNASINPNTGVRAEEAEIQAVDWFGLYVEAADVTIAGFTMNGTGIADYGIYAYTASGLGGLSISNNVIENDITFGFVGWVPSGPASSTNIIAQNKFDQAGERSVVPLYNYYANVIGNVITNTQVGIYAENPNTPESSGQVVWSGNTIAATRAGIWYNNAYGTATPQTIISNTITAQDSAGLRFSGIWLTSLGGSVNPVIAGNDIIIPSGGITPLAVGYDLWNDFTSTGIQISGGTVSNAGYGVWANNYDGYPTSTGSQAGSTKVTVSGLIVNNASLAGVYIKDNPLNSLGATVQATVTGNTAIHTSAIGVLVQGTNASASVINNSASITSNAVGISVDMGKALLQNNDLTANTVAGIWATNGAVVDAGNCTGANVTELGISTGGNDLTGYLTGAAKAIINGNVGGSPVVLADHDNFGATTANDIIPGAFSGAVDYSQLPAVVAAPANTNYICISEVPSGATDLAGFLALGGYVSASAATISYSDSAYPVGSGTITRTYSIADGCSVTNTCVQTITVSDTIAPTIAPLPNLTFSTDLGECSKSNVTWTVVAGDNCALASVISIPPSPATFNKGITTVTNIATDTSGNIAITTFTVTISDTEAPVIVTCATNQTIVADVTAHALIPDVTGQIVATENCGSITLTQIPAAGTVVGLGAHPVTVWATDLSSNSNSCGVTITVIDQTVPALVLPPNVTVTTLQDKDPYATGYATATDANGPVTIAYDDSRTGLTNCNATGNILRTWTATDASANVTTNVQIITVIDTNAPYFTYLPANITVTNDPGNCSAVVSYASTAVDASYFQGFENTNWMSGNADNAPSTDWNDSNSQIYRVASGTDGIISKSGLSHAVIDSSSVVRGGGANESGAFCRLGGYSGTFGNGFRSAVSVYIDLNDATVATNGYGFDVDTAASTSSAGFLRDFIFHVASDASSNILVTADNNSSQSKLDLSLVPGHATLTTAGWYTFEWVFRDTNGVLAVDLNLRDSTGVLLWTTTRSTVGDLIPSVAGGNRYLWFTYATPLKLAIDNTVLERNATVITSLPSGTAFDVGTTTVTNTAIDLCGNSTNATFTVTVADHQAPVIQPLTDLVATNDLGVCSAVVTFPTITATDNCAVATIVATPASGTVFDVGTNTVIVVATDIHGNTSTNSFTVTVADHQAPVIQSIANIVVPNDFGVCGAVVNYATLTATDNCAVASIVATPSSPHTFDVGTTPVTVVATDIHGNSSTNIFTVTVNDVEPPSANVPANIVQGVDVGQSYATISFTLPAQTDNCGLPSQVATPASGSQFPVGTNTVTVVVTDVHDNHATNTFTVAVIALPAITSQPVGRTNNAGTTAIFSVVASSPSPLSYQWIKSGSGNIADATNATLTLNNVQDADVADYTVQINNLAGSVVSAPPAHLTVIDPPVIANILPPSQTNNATTTAVFTVNVTGTGTAPFSYLWSKITPTTTNVLSDTGHISGSTSNVLTIANVLAADRATYSVAISNPAGTVTTNATLFVVDPFIASQPVSVTNVFGGNAAFSVTAVGTAAVAYQWQQNSVNLPGQTASNLVLNGITDSAAGNYRVLVSNSAGSITSSIATLTITHPPVFTLQPTNQIVNQTSNVLMVANVGGDSPFTYQWRKNGTNISDGGNILGTATRTLILNNVTANDSAVYSLFVTNLFGVNTSSNATLTVIVPPAITSQPVSITTNVGAVASFVVTNTGSPSVYRWYKGATLLTNNVNISGATTTVLTISNLSGADSANYAVTISNAAAMVTSSSATLTVIDPIITSQPVSLTRNAGQTASFTVATIGTAPAYRWYKNTSLLSDGGNVSGSTTTNLVITNVQQANAANYSVVVSNAFGMVTSAPPAQLTVIDPPLIVTAPLSQTNNAGATVNFTVSYTGTAPSFQWYTNGTVLNGATSQTLTLANISQANAVNYTVVLTNAAGSVTSSPAAHLTVIDAPVITHNPDSLTVNATSNATFTVSYTGTSPGFQWYTNGAPLSGATSATLALNNVSQANAVNYTVVLSNAAGSVTSSPAAHLTVIDAPVITHNPDSLTVNATSNATFAVSYTGTSPSFQWYTNGQVLIGATSATLTLNNVSQANAVNYTVVLSNAAGSVTSSPAAHLTVIDAPVIVINGQPVSRTNNAGTTATFTVAYTGTAPSFQWLKNGTNLLNDLHVIGATSATLTLSNVFGIDQGNYSVVLSNAAATVTSSSAMLTVIDPIITSQPAGVTNFVGSDVGFSVTTVGTNPKSYQWYQDGQILFYQTNSTLAINDIAGGDEGAYTVVITNVYGSVTSAPAYLSAVAPLIVNQPASYLAVLGQPANFSVDVNGLAPFTYQWQKNGANISGATNRIYTINAVAFIDADIYRVIVSNPQGVETSQYATLTVTDQPIITIAYSNAMPVVSIRWIPGNQCAISASTNLFDWSPITTNAAPFSFVDTNGLAQRFYRGLTLP